MNIRNAPCGWQKDSKYVYIGRFHHSKKYGLIHRSKWFNPFTGNRAGSIESFKEYLYGTRLINDIGELEDKILVCWCKPLPCHGDVLVEALTSLSNRAGDSKCRDRALGKEGDRYCLRQERVCHRGVSQLANCMSDQEEN
ncbi:MAG: DUF4326 domain-containing protein [bacterium]